MLCGSIRGLNYFMYTLRITYYLWGRLGAIKVMKSSLGYGLGGARGRVGITSSIMELPMQSKARR